MLNLHPFDDDIYLLRVRNRAERRQCQTAETCRQYSLPEGHSKLLDALCRLQCPLPAHRTLGTPMRPVGAAISRTPVDEKLCKRAPRPILQREPTDRLPRRGQVDRQNSHADVAGRELQCACRQHGQKMTGRQKAQPGAERERDDRRARLLESAVVKRLDHSQAQHRVGRIKNPAFIQEVGKPDPTPPRPPALCARRHDDRVVVQDFPR